MSEKPELSDELPKYDVQAIKAQGEAHMVSHAAALSAHQALHGALQNCDISKIDPVLKSLIAQVAQRVAEDFGAGEPSEIAQANSETLSPTWFEELKAKVGSEEIPNYKGIEDDGDPIEFLKNYYGKYIDEGLLLRQLEKLDIVLWRQFSGYVQTTTRKKPIEVLKGRRGHMPISFIISNLKEE